MNIEYKTLPRIAVLAFSLAIAACDSGGSGAAGSSVQPVVTTPIDVSKAALVSSGTKTTGGVIDDSGINFTMPTVETHAGALSLSIPADPTPEFESRAVVSEGSGEVINFGQAVTLKYDLFRWSDGAIVDSSAMYEFAHTAEAGNTQSSALPDYVSSSLLGRSLGDIMQIVLPRGTADLPQNLDSEDAYVLLVELL